MRHDFRYPRTIAFFSEFQKTCGSPAWLLRNSQDDFFQFNPDQKIDFQF